MLARLRAWNVVYSIWTSPVLPNAERHCIQGELRVQYFRTIRRIRQCGRRPQRQFWRRTTQRGEARHCRQRTESATCARAPTGRSFLAWDPRTAQKQPDRIIAERQLPVSKDAVKPAYRRLSDQGSAQVNSGFLEPCFPISGVFCPVYTLPMSQRPSIWWPGTTTTF